MLRCTELASARVRSLTAELRRCLAADRVARRAGAPVAGLAQVQLERVGAAAAAVRLSARVREGALTAQKIQQMEQDVRHRAAAECVGCDCYLNSGRDVTGVLVATYVVCENGP